MAEWVVLNRRDHCTMHYSKLNKLCGKIGFKNSHKEEKHINNTLVVPLSYVFQVHVN